MRDRKKIFRNSEPYDRERIDNYLGKFSLSKLDVGGEQSDNHEKIIEIYKDTKQIIPVQGDSYKISMNNSPIKSFFYDQISQVPLAENNGEPVVDWFSMIFGEPDDEVKGRIWSLAQTILQSECYDTISVDMCTKYITRYKQFARTFPVSVLTHMIINNQFTDIGDFSAGWLCRLTSVFLANLLLKNERNFSYFGTDPQYQENHMKKRMQGLTNIYTEYLTKNGIGSPEFCIKGIPAQHAGSDGDFTKRSFDLIFTCPPYPGAGGAKERYCNGPEFQIHNLADKDEKNFAEEIYKMSKVFFDNLRQGGSMVMVVHTGKISAGNLKKMANKKDFIKYPGYEMYYQLIKNLGGYIEKVGSLQSDKKGPKETILVFVKRETLSKQISFLNNNHSNELMGMPYNPSTFFQSSNTPSRPYNPQFLSVINPESTRNFEMIESNVDVNKMSLDFLTAPDNFDDKFEGSQDIKNTGGNNNLSGGSPAPNKRPFFAVSSSIFDQKNIQDHKKIKGDEDSEHPVNLGNSF